MIKISALKPTGAASQIFHVPPRRVAEGRQIEERAETFILIRAYLEAPPAGQH